MNNFIKTNRVFLSALALVIMIIVVLISLRNPSVSYKTSPEDIASLLHDSVGQISPLLIYSMNAKGGNSQILVDVRSSDEFSKGHIDNAVNIPVRELLQKRSLAFFRELDKTGTTAVLYGNDQLEASSPWLLLKQLGFDNIRVMQGGYSFYKSLPLPDSLLQATAAILQLEVPRIDISAFNKTTSSASSGTQTDISSKKAEKVVPVKKAASTGGGC